jgi:hypothetical protein
MKMLNTIILAVSAMVVGTAGLSAQTKAVAYIPFEFQVATATMPAGNYTLETLSASGELLRITNNDKRNSVAVLVWKAERPKGEPTNGKIKFNRYEDRYFFSEVWTPAGLHAHAMPCKLERELRAGNDGTVMASVFVPLAATD